MSTLSDAVPTGQQHVEITSTTASPPGSIDLSKKLVIVMVGLPARGKSYVSKKLCRYLAWLQYDVQIFNVGDRRRKVNRNSASLMSSRPETPTKPTSAADDHSAAFFDPENQEAAKLRQAVALETLDEMLDCLLTTNVSIALFDATNTTVERRDLIIRKVRQRVGRVLPVLFLESQCIDQELLESNFRLKLAGPDYKGKDPVQSLIDFKQRVAMYEKRYVAIGQYEEKAGYSFCQMIDVGRKFIMHNVHGFLMMQCVQYLQHFNLSARQIWLTRHGESTDDTLGRIGGNSSLSPKGLRYSAALSRFVGHQRAIWEASHDADSPYSPTSAYEPTDRKPYHVWTSNMQRSVQTAQFFNAAEYNTSHLRILDELNAGILDGLTREQIDYFYRDWVAKRQQDKLHFRYPGVGGEGYVDITQRLKAVILEVERLTDHVLLVSGLAVTRVLLAYFTGKKMEEMTELDVPLGTLYMLEPKPYGVAYKEFVYDETEDWFKEKD